MARAALLQPRVAHPRVSCVCALRRMVACTSRVAQGLRFLSPPRMQWIPAPAYAGVTTLPGNDFMECHPSETCPPRKPGSGGPSIRVGTSIFCYPNPVIGEFMVGLGNFHFRHMAGYAFPLGHGAAPGGTHGVGRGVFAGKTMAGQALGIVKSSVALPGLMGIMQARQPIRGSSGS